MAHRMKKSTQPKTTDVVLYWVSIALAILGAADAIYLLVLKYSDNTGMCLGSGGCATVNASSYSMVGAIPVALIGLLGYLAILAVHILERNSRQFKENGPLFVFGMSLTGVVYSAYLTWIEFAVIKAVCPFCVTSAVLITLVFILAIIRLVKQFAS